jgi:hypothetical protein
MAALIFLTARPHMKRHPNVARAKQALLKGELTMDWTDEPIDLRKWKRVPGNSGSLKGRLDDGGQHVVP